MEIAIPQPAGNIEGKIILMRSFKDTSYPHICHKPTIVLFKNRAKISSRMDSKHSVKIKMEKYLEYITNLHTCHPFAPRSEESSDSSLLGFQWEKGTPL